MILLLGKLLLRSAFLFDLYILSSPSNSCNSSTVGHGKHFRSWPLSPRYAVSFTSLLNCSMHEGLATGQICGCYGLNDDDAGRGASRIPMSWQEHFVETYCRVCQPIWINSEESTHGTNLRSTRASGSVTPGKPRADS